MDRLLEYQYLTTLSLHLNPEFILEVEAETEHLGVHLEAEEPTERQVTEPSGLLRAWV